MLKRGVSPLIATILLIAFAVALGTVVMNWGLSLDPYASDHCKGVEIALREIAEGFDACHGASGKEGYINFILDGKGAKTTDGLSIWMAGEKGTKIFDLDDVFIAKGQLYEKKDNQVSYDYTVYGAMNNIQFIPKVKAETYELCPKAAVKADRLKTC